MSYSLSEILLIIILVVVVVNLIVLFLILSSQNKNTNRIEGIEKTIENSKKDLEDDFERLSNASNHLLSDKFTNFSVSVKDAIETLADYMFKSFKQSSTSSTEQLNSINQTLHNSAVMQETKLEGIRNTVEKNLSSLREDNNTKLEEMRKTVDEKLQETLETRLSQSFKLVSEQLEAVHKGLGEMQNLAVGVGDLKKVLSNVKNRGILGEIQLSAILKDILAESQYDENINTIPGSTERVEFAIKLPADDSYIYLPIDSKFPADSYIALQNAIDDANKEQIDIARKNLVNTLKKEAKDIKEKYVATPYTTDFGVMFLPTEGLYCEAINQGLMEVLQKDFKITICGPSTMAALLNSLQMGFKTLAIQQRSSEVWNLLGSVKNEFDKFEAALTTAQNRIQQTSDELDKLVGTRTRAINRQLRNVQSNSIPIEEYGNINIDVKDGK